MAEKQLTWTTWEELLLACAVKRHGLRDWDSVAMELRNRSSLPLLLTAQVCKNKYHDLKRRFMVAADIEGEEEVDTIPWLEELRKLRVAELKQEVHRYDLSIQSLQLKVKRLEEEHERSLKESGDDDGKPDLEKDFKEERSGNEKNDGADAPEDVSGDGSERENRSFNESNSTENRGAGDNEDRREPEPVETGDVKPDPASSDSKPAGEDSCNGSSDTVAKHAAAKPIQGKKGGDPVELQDSAGQWKEGTRESSDVQSTASLKWKRRREKEVSGRSRGGELVVSPATIKREAEKSEPLAGLLDIIRSHKHGSMFESRLEIQETDEYKNVVRQHLDLETIRTRLEQGAYSSCPGKFYRDLMLLYTNAVVYFPKGSSQSMAASELLDLISKEMRKSRTQRSDSTPEPAPSKPTSLRPKPDPAKLESSSAKQKASVPIVVCRKRSSISSAKASNNNSEEKQNNRKPTTSKSVNEEEQSPARVKTRERIVTGTRSLRKSTKSGVNSITNKNQTIANDASSADQKGEAQKTDKKKTEVTVKKQGAADFLKRIKRNSPLKETPSKSSKRSDANSGGKNEQKKRGDRQKDTPASKKNVGRGGRGGGGRQGKLENSPSKRGVGRPAKKGREAAAGGGGRKRGRAGEVGSKPEKKRARR